MRRSGHFFIRPQRIALAALLLCSASIESRADSGPWAFKTLHEFCLNRSKYCNEWNFANGPLLRDANGDLFGSVYSWGSNTGRKPRFFGDSIIYELSPAGTYKALYEERCDGQFCGCPDNGGLIMDTAGNLYGTSHCGGYGGSEHIFELMPPAGGTGTWTKVMLHRFGSQANDGMTPNGSLVYRGESKGKPYDGMSPLYGTTQYGGAFNSGTVFRLTFSRHKKAWSEKVLYSFCADDGQACNDGKIPMAAPILDATGNLYGTTLAGGSGGVVYRLSSDAQDHWSETGLYSFCVSQDCADGAAPYGPVVMDSAGNLLGTTVSGGAFGYGTVFLVEVGNQWAEAVLHSFDPNPDGQNPYAGLYLDSAGQIYGTTTMGGPSQYGTVFRLGDSFDVLYSFSMNNTGYELQTPVMGDGAGGLLGTGSALYGSVYHLTPPAPVR